MNSSPEADLAALIEAVRRSGARPFKDATGDWSTAVEVALLDTVLSIGAHVDGAYGAGVLPRLRALKAFRGQANMLRVLTALGPMGLSDFVAEQRQMDRLLAAATALLGAGINVAADVDPDSQQHRAALLEQDGIPDLAWPYFLIALGHQTPKLIELEAAWIDGFVDRAISGKPMSGSQREVLMQDVATALDAEHQRKSFGTMPKFTLAQVQQAIFRAEYARATA